MAFKYSFKQWCLDNNRQDILDRWDYEKNDFDPQDIGYASERKIWFKCLKGIHPSEQHSIVQLHRNLDSERCIECVACNSFAQYVIDKYGEQYFQSIWSNNNIVSPWIIPHGSDKKILLINPETGEEYFKTPSKFFQPTYRRPPNDSNVRLGHSLGDLHPEVLSVWSVQNEKTPYDYCVNSDAEVWWKCENGLHDDYLRRISSSKVRDYRCPKCGRLGAGLIDLKGKQFGQLTVTEFDKSIEGIPYWKCHCECGRDVSIRGITLRRGEAKTCGDRTIHYSGENNHSWKGGKRSDNQVLRGKKVYRHWRDDIIKDRGKICVITGNPVNKPNLHHIYPFADYPELAFEEWNTIILDDQYHNMFVDGSFHKVYGTKHTTPEQLQEYINNKRKELGIEIPFNIEEYIEEMKEYSKTSNIRKPNIDLKEEQTNGK